MEKAVIVEKQRIRPVTYGLALYLLLIPLDFFSLGSIGSLLKIIVFIPLGLALLDFKYLRIQLCPLVVVQMLFWLLAVASLFYSVNADLTIFSLKPLTLNLLLVLCLGVLVKYNQREMQLIQKTLIVSGWFTILLMLLFSDLSQGARLTLNIGGSLQDQNYINAYFLYTFSWHCSRMLTGNKKLHIIPVLFVIFVVLLTGSRGALLSFILVLFVHICIGFSRTKHMIRNIALSALLIVFLLVLFEVFLTQMPESIAERFSPDYIAEQGTTGRMQIWSFLWQHFSESSILRMFFGCGYETTQYVNTLNGKVAHNLYLDILISMGLIGLFLQIMSQVMVLVIFLKKKEYAAFGMFAGLMCMCLSLSLVSHKSLWGMVLIAFILEFNSSMVKHNNQNGKTVLSS